MRTLVLVAHGSLSEPRAFIPTFDHAAAIRETGRFDAVREAFLKGDPAIGDVIETIEDGEVVVVPLFMTEGYYTGEVIPNELEGTESPGIELRYTPPVGTHAGIADVVIRRVESAIDDRREGVGLALVGHGSAENPEAAAAVREHAARVREREPFAEVRSFFLEEAPPVERIPGGLEAGEVVVVPLFMAEGHHVREDIPGRIGLAGGSPSEIGGRRVWYTDPVGTDPAIADIALERAEAALEAATEPESIDRAGRDRPGDANQVKP